MAAEGKVESGIRVPSVTADWSAQGGFAGVELSSRSAGQFHPGRLLNRKTHMAAECFNTQFKEKNPGLRLFGCLVIRQFARR